MEELLQKINRIFNEHKLLGNHDFTKDEYSLMVDFVGELSEKFISSPNFNFKQDYYKLIFSTLVAIAKRWKDTSITDEDSEDNSGFWSFIFRTLIGQEEYNQRLYGAFTRIISQMKSLNNLPVVSIGKKYYATLMMHSFAPKNSIFSFFDLCYNIFRKDLDYGFTSDDEWLCILVAAQMKSVLGGGYREDREVSIGSSAYSIKIGLRSFTLNEDLNGEFVKFIKDAFYQINKLFNREKINENTRLKRYLAEWWKNKTESELLSDETARKKRIPIVSKQNIVAKYLRNDNEVFLCIPPIRLDNETNILRLLVFVDGEQVYCEVMRTKRGELVVATKQKEFELNNLLRKYDSINIRIEIKENEVVIFDSEKNKTTSLSREFILFDDEKEVFSHINKPTNYFVYSKDIDALQSTPTELTTRSTNLYNIYPKAGECLKGEIKQVFFIPNEKEARLGENVCLIGNLTDVEWLLDEISCIVYGAGVKLMIPENVNLKALELRIDRKLYKLQNLKHEQFENNIYMFGLFKLGLIKQCEPTEISLYSFDKETTILNEIIIVLPYLNIQFNHPFYYNDIEREVTITNANASHKLSWSNQDSEIKCQINDGVLLIKIPYFRWRINNNKWHNETLIRRLWYSNLLKNGDLLEIDNPKEDEEIKIYGKTDGEIFIIAKNQRGTFEVGRKIYEKESKINISVYFTDNKNEEFVLFNVATKEQFIENPVIYNNGEVYWDVENTFLGISNKIFLLDIGGKNVFREQIKGENRQILNSIKENIYRVTVKIKKQNIFSINEEWVILFEGTLIVGKPEKFRFKNKYICIERINTTFSPDVYCNWITPSEDYILRDLEYIEIQDGERIFEYYIGKVKIAGQENPYIDYLENEKGEKDKINPVRIEMRSNNTFWLLAGYNKDTQDFLGELIIDVKNNTLCNINSKDMSRYKVANLFKFKVVEYV